MYPARMTIPQFNARLQAEGVPLELVKGTGYLYFVTIAPHDYTSHSEMVFAFNQLTPQEWHDRAVAVWAEINDKGN